MSIFPLPQFEADLEADRKAYEALQPPKTIVVRFGAMRMLGEYPYDGQAKPGCGSKLVARTHRGTELVEMLTTTCPNSGCGKSVSRQEMLRYFENSGGRDYPFYTDGRILRVATVDDMNQAAALEAKKPQWVAAARRAQQRVGPGNIKIVDVEAVLGGERLVVHFLSEERVDFRALVMELAHDLHARVEMHQVGARDEARLTGDYERCGQHCCCRQFLKVLKPVSMKSAKTQKATLDPLKISGRCGRLMCCLRYEDTTYEELKKNLPKKKVPVQTPDGPGIVIDTQILTQLVLVRLDATGEDGAYPIENLTMLPAGPALPQAKPRNKDESGREQGRGQGQNQKRGANPVQQQGQQQGQQQAQQSGHNRRPMTEEEREKKRMQKLVPRSEFRGDDLHRPIDRNQPPLAGQPPEGKQPPGDQQPPGGGSGTGQPPGADR